MTKEELIEKVADALEDVETLDLTEMARAAARVALDAAAGVAKERGDRAFERLTKTETQEGSTAYAARVAEAGEIMHAIRALIPEAQ